MFESFRPGKRLLPTRSVGEWNSEILGIPVITLLPLIFAVLMVNVSMRDTIQEIVVGRMLVHEAASGPRSAVAYFIHFLRVMCVMQFIDSTSMVLGLSNGPFNLVADSLALIFILDWDKLLRFGSKKSLFGEAKAATNRAHARTIEVVAARLAVPVLGQGTRERQRGGRAEEALLVALAAFSFVATQRMQRLTSHGRMTHPDDTARQGVRVAFRVGSYASLACVLLFVNFTCRAVTTRAKRKSVLAVLTLTVVEFVVFIFVSYIILYNLLSEALTYGDFDKAYFQPHAVLGHVLAIYDDDDMVYDDDIFKPGDDDTPDFEGFFEKLHA